MCRGYGSISGYILSYTNYVRPADHSGSLMMINTTVLGQAVIIFVFSMQQVIVRCRNFAIIMVRDSVYNWNLLLILAIKTTTICVVDLVFYYLFYVHYLKQNSISLFVINNYTPLVFALINFC